MADPFESPFRGGLPAYEELISSKDSMILSASGWRKVFAIDNEEESRRAEISSADKVLAGVAALTFSEYLKKKNKEPRVLIGMDTRPTGPAICDVMSRVFIAEGVGVKNLFITAAPEIMAYSSITDDTDGFAYISASHNPIGHNGFKFGEGGGVIGGKDSAALIDSFLACLAAPAIIQKIQQLTERADTNLYMKILNESAQWKNEAYSAYLSFSKRIIADSENPEEQEAFFSVIKERTAHKAVGIIGELNGSARSLSVDKDIISAAGVKCLLFNNTPGEVVHRIVPEGFSLNQCKELLEGNHRKDSSFIIGYVPDNDGDRGNIVFMNSRSGKAEILEAQEVFALAVLGELAFVYSQNTQNNGENQNLAVAVNGPTSMRIDRIAESFGAEVFRAEVGEANVVNLAQKLRNGGYTVRILGEGSNGGNITHPAKVRDPINTIFSLLKILLYKAPDSEDDLFKTWCMVSGQQDMYKEDFSLIDVISTLPRYTTTNANEKRAIMKITTADHAVLKSRYEKIFLEEWDKKREFLKDTFNIYSWREINYEGIQSAEGMGSKYRTGKEKGGLKIVFSDNSGKETCYLWMRGSGTEPVFRILADVEGEKPEKEEWLLNWHREIIEKADKGEKS